MFQTLDNSQLLRRVLCINAELTIVSSLKHKNTQPSYIFNRKNPQNSETQNGLRRGLDFIALVQTLSLMWSDQLKQLTAAPSIYKEVNVLYYL
jgi:hypothetical protein